MLVVAFLISNYAINKLQNYLFTFLAYLEILFCHSDLVHFNYNSILNLSF